MKCIPSGVPDKYMFKDWEHTTEYNEHIRFLPITKKGNETILTIPSYVSGKTHYRDKGIYICRASNNISTTDGMFVMQKYNLDLNGAPYFVSSTQNTQYGVYLKTVRIKIKFVSDPEYNNYDVYKNGTKFARYTPTVHRNMNLTDNIYGKNNSVKGTILSLQIQIDTLDDFSLYKVVVKNAIGYSNHTIRLLSANKETIIVETPLSIQTVVILSLVIIIAILVAGMGLYIQSDNSIMPTVIRDIDEISAEYLSTSSDNERDSSEYLDDGYEQPYTALVVTDQEKDDHVYLTTKKNSNYENAVPFQNIACGHACDFLKEDSQSDKTNAYDDHENFNLIYDVNECKEQNDSVPQIYIYPQINKAEYVNLSLNQ
ncbi:Hypothetical predicted protein [Mytilus galloprovincialis]|uniref:Ig-like domain-containing protein n=1 Tax=Mytilus galloprovincialis TaxID=29158 RepID=A0A8B6G129_MYTGA|nr:Hypothetical predicted protein [Mytilus galloprovincialis]